jgi:hypothetical protein
MTRFYFKYSSSQKAVPLKREYVCFDKKLVSCRKQVFLQTARGYIFYGEFKSANKNDRWYALPFEFAEVGPGKFCKFVSESALEQNDLPLLSEFTLNGRYIQNFLNPIIFFYRKRSFNIQTDSCPIQLSFNLLGKIERKNQAKQRKCIVVSKKQDKYIYLEGRLIQENHLDKFKDNKMYEYKFDVLDPDKITEIITYYEDCFGKGSGRYVGLKQEKFDKNGYIVYSWELDKNKCKDSIGFPRIYSYTKNKQGKVVQINIFDRLGGKIRQVRFKYDVKGRLIWAYNADLLGDYYNAFYYYIR